MAANTIPIFPAAPRNARGRSAGANTASDGSGSNIVDLVTAGANGSMVDRIRWRNSQATAAASSAMIVRAWVTDASNANPRLIEEVIVGSATRSTTVPGSGGVIEFPGGFPLESGQHIWVAQSVYAGAQDQMDFVAELGDY